MKGNITIAMLAAVCFGIAVLPACTLLPKEEAPLKPPLIKPVKENFDLYEVKRGNIAKQVTGSSTFAAEKSQYLYFRESGGRLLSIDVKSGDKIKKGDVLARLEKGDLEAKIRQQQLNLEKANIQLQQTKAEKRGDNQAIRLKTIEVESAQIQLDLLKEQLAKMVLVSEFDGIITYVDTIRQGDPVAAFKPIVAVSDPKQVKLVYEFWNSNDITGLQVQMEVAIKYKGKEYNGKIVQTPASAPPTTDKAQAEKNAKTIVMSVEGLTDAEIGDQANFVIAVEKKDDVIVIPKAGLRAYMGREYVQLLEGESRKEIDVEKGIVSSTEIEIRKGLEEGQKVILNQ